MPVLELVEPAYQWVPEHVSSSGQECIDLCSDIGLPLDPEQEVAIHAILAERSGGNWAALEAAVIACRQNIKTHVFKAIAIADLWLFDAELVVWSAHEFNTTMEAFRDVDILIDGSELLSKRIKRRVNSNAETGFEFHSGQRLRFKARTKTGGRGLTGTRVILDEAFALQASHMGSLLPTLSAKSMTGNPQILYGSSAGQVGSQILRNIRDRGRAGGDPSLVYIEWCAPNRECQSEGCDHHVGSEGCVLDDREMWAKANLALGRRISTEFVETERRSLPPEEFARERLGWWDEPLMAGATIDPRSWVACADRKKDPVEPVALAVDVAPGHSSAAVVCCGEIVYVLEHGAGMSWVPSKLASLVRDKNVTAIGIDPSSPAAALIPDLEKPEAEGGAGLSIRTPKNPNGLLVLFTGREMTSACELLLSAITEKRFRHSDQGVLNAAVEGAYRRQMGDTGKWSRRDSSVDITALVGATEAWFLWSQQGEAEADFYQL